MSPAIAFPECLPPASYSWAPGPLHVPLGSPVPSTCLLTLRLCHPLFYDFCTKTVLSPRRSVWALRCSAFPPQPFRLPRSGLSHCFITRISILASSTRHGLPISSLLWVPLPHEEESRLLKKQQQEVVTLLLRTVSAGTSSFGLQRSCQNSLVRLSGMPFPQISTCAQSSSVFGLPFGDVELEDSFPGLVNTRSSRTGQFYREM